MGKRQNTKLHESLITNIYCCFKAQRGEINGKETHQNANSCCFLFHGKGR